MRLDQIHETTLEEGWKQNLAAGVLGAATMLGGVPKASAQDVSNQTPAPVERRAEAPLSADQLRDLARELKKNRTPENTKMVMDQILRAIDAKVGDSIDNKDFNGAKEIIAKTAFAFENDEKKELLELRRELIKQGNEYLKMDRLKKSAESNINDRVKLIEIYLLKYDNIKEALKLSTGLQEGQRELKNVVQLVSEDINTLSEKQLLGLAEWYYANGKDEVKALQKAKLYIDKYLEIHTTPDAELLKVKALADKIEKSIITIIKPTIKQIAANKKWQPVMEVKAGQKLKITASGTWNAGSGGAWEATADGGITKKGQGRFYLEGRIGDGIPFKIGSKKDFVAPSDGVLSMQMKDNSGGYDDNVGTITVKIISLP